MYHVINDITENPSRGLSATVQGRASAGITWLMTAQFVAHVQVAQPVSGMKEIGEGGREHSNR